MSASLDILKKYWGHQSFRPLQSEIIESIRSGHDTLALMPTGGGKSICFQVPGLEMNGVCLVVSPLIALMKDQVENLKKLGIPAEAVYSGLPYREMDRIFDNAIFGGLKFLYLSPERLMTELAKERIQQMRLCFLVVDEAHCISQWGYDFRPAYLKIAELRTLHPKSPVMALTATATPEVARDIQEKLLFKNGQVFQKSFVRDNLAYVVRQEENKLHKLLEILKGVPGTGIIYARNRRQTKEIASFLRKNDISADYYHAGLDHEIRNLKQDAWIDDSTRVMVATNAFGMGIDKPDVRTVVHMDLPDSLEAYYQEGGRAGRDGKKAYAIILYEKNDQTTLLKNLEKSFPEISAIKRVYQALGSYYQLAVGSSPFQSFNFDLVEFCQKYQMDILTTLNCLSVLEQEGWIILTESVFSPSMAKFMVDREHLYDYQLKAPQFDPIIKALLRSYTGIFAQHVRIQERNLASYLKVPEKSLKGFLSTLHQEGIIDYQPQNDKPQLIFTRERVGQKNLNLDVKSYRWRKARKEAMVKKMIAYAEEPVCRSQQLVQYFGEKDSKPCGICDVCIDNRKQGLTPAVYERYKEKILRLLQKENLDEIQILDSFHPGKRDTVVETLAYMLDEHLLIKSGNQLKIMH